MRKHIYPKFNKNKYIILLLLAIIVTTLIYLSRKNVKEEFESLSSSDKADATIRSDLDNYNDNEEEDCPKNINWKNKIEVVQFQEDDLSGGINANSSAIKTTAILAQQQTNAQRDADVKKK